MKKLKYVLLFMLVCCLSFGAKVSNKKLKDVSIVLDWYPNAIHSFLYIAKEKGYFEKEGINLVIHYPANGSDPLALPAAGKADFGLYYPHHLIMAKSNEDIPVKVIGAITQGPLNTVIAETSANITRPRDLEGKTIGYSDGPLTEDILKTIVEKDGGDISKVKVLDVGFELLTATITKQVDATLGGFVNHEVPVMRDKGMDVTYFFPTDYGVPNYYEVVIVANEKAVEEKRDLYIGFLRAINKGFNDMKANPEKALDTLLAHQEADQFPLTRNVEKQSIDILLPLMDNGKVPFLHQDKENWQENIDWLVEHKIIKKKIKAEDVFINLYKEI